MDIPAREAGFAAVTSCLLCLALLSLLPAAGRAQGTGQPNLAIPVEEWAPYADGGNPPAIVGDTSTQAGGSPALRLIYRDAEPHWGSVGRQVTLTPDTRAIRLRFLKHSSGPGAALYLWLLEPDGDRWVQQVTVDGQSFGDLRQGWHETEVPAGLFRYEPSGDGKRGMRSASRLLIGCNFADLDVTFAEIRLVLAGETPAESPARLPPPARVEGEKGRIAILAENFVIRRPETEGPFGVTRPLTEAEKRGSPSASDPEFLAELATRAGYGATLLSASALESPGYLSPSNFDVLVIPCAPYYPLNAGEAIRSYLTAGGSLFTTGGYAFDQPCVRAGEGWQTVDQALTVERVDREEPPVRLNHRFAIPADGQGPPAGTVGLFDPSYPLKRAAYAESLVDFIPRVRMDGPFQGWAACALLGSNNPVFPAPYARRIPLLMSFDAIGRETGALGQIVHHHAGPFRGSSWAAFGVTNRDLFARSGPLAAEFADILDRLVRKVYLHSLRTDLALYRPGETVTLSVSVANFQRQAVKVWVQFELFTEEGISVQKLPPEEKEVPPGFEERFTGLWTVPVAPGDDFYEVVCRLSSESLSDEMRTGFCVEDRQALQSGPPVLLKDNYFLRDGQPSFLLGTNQTGAVFCSAFEDPLIWKRDLDAMSGAGLSIMRVLHFSPFVVSQTGEPRARPLDLNVESLPRWLERRLDALVQLTARYGVALMLTLHDWMGLNLTDEELEAQRRFASLVAGRYRDCPHVFFDIQNEPEVALDRPKTDFALWNRFLLERYGSREALQDAWESLAGDERPGAIEIPQEGKDWTDGRRVDLDLFRVWLLDRWAKANAEGVRQVSKAPITIGFIQHMTFADQLLGMAWLDFANKHYYGDKRRFAAEIKVVDRRFEGKSLTVGEFGSVVDHDARIRGISRESADWQWYLEAAGTTLGMGGAFILNWCWKEMPDNVFPWGINSPNDNLPRETLLAFRAFALATRDFRPQHVPPTVYLIAPDLNRMGAQAEKVNGAVLRAIEALLQLQVEFGVVNESALDRLPTDARALILPVPYTLKDEAFEKLEAFVRGGGALLVTGDITFDAHRRRARTDRLSRLFGLEFVRELLAPVQTKRDEKGELLPAIEVRPAGAERDEKEPLWVNRSGNGLALFDPVPRELDSTPSALYARALELAGIPVRTLLPDAEGVLVLRSAGAREGEDALFVVSRSAEPRRIRLPGEVELDLQPGSSCLLVRRGGRPVSVIASGSVTLSGKEWARLDAPAALVSLDGRPLNESSMLAVHLLGQGQLRINGFPAAQARIRAGRIRNGRWQTLATRQPQQTEQLLIIPAEEALAFAMMIVAPEENLEEAARQVERRLLSRAEAPAQPARR
jgi:hypothetical protein